MKKTLINHILLLPFVAGSILLTAGESLAQERDSKIDNFEENIIQLEQITVTSQKTAATKQEVSSNVSVFDGDTLEDLGVESLEQIVGLTPNISFYRPDNRLTYLVYRGIGGTTNMNKVFNINYDGVTIPYVALNTALDVERIEILRGSQGSLYGSNSHAGIVNIITRSPGDMFEGYARASYGSYNTEIFQTGFGGPIGENLKYRLALGYKRSDGYFHNTFLDIDDGNKQEQISGYGKFIYETPEGGEFTLGVLVDSFDDGMDNGVAGGGYDTLHNDSGYNDGSVFSPTLTWKKNIGDVTLTSITNYSKSNYGFFVDWDHLSADIYSGEFDETYNTITEEFRLEGGNGGKLKWLGGLFLMSESLETETILRYGKDAAMAGMTTGSFMKQNSTVDTTEVALFGNLNYRILPQFETVLGLRLDHTYKDMKWRGSFSMMSSTDKSYDESWLGVIPSASISWIPEKDQRVYLSVSRGFKAGDFNNVQIDPTVVTEPVDPEYTTTYETGYKGVFANKRLEVEMSVFYIDWTDMQVETPLNASTYVKQNAAEAHSSGMELELRSRITQGLTAFFGAGKMLEYEFDEFSESTQGDLSGKKLPATNEYTFSTGFTWHLMNGLSLSSNARLYGPKYFDEANQFEQDSYTIVDAKIGYETQNWSVHLFGRNLLDEEYAVTVGAGRSSEMSGEPLVAGVDLHVDL